MNITIFKIRDSHAMIQKFVMSKTMTLIPTNSKKSPMHNAMTMIQITPMALPIDSTNLHMQGLP
jgi:hypothetical protein